MSKTRLFAVAATAFFATFAQAADPARAVAAPQPMVVQPVAPMPAAAPAATAAPDSIAKPAAKAAKSTKKGVKKSKAKPKKHVTH